MVPCKRRKFAFLASPLLSFPPSRRLSSVQPQINSYQSPIALKPPPTKTSSASSATPPKSPTPSPSPSPSPLTTALILHSVPFLWGTYPTLSFYLTHLPTPPPPNLLNFFTYIVALLPLPFLRPPDTKLPYLAGAELGTYLFLGTVLLLFSLQYTTAPRAALLVQSTTIFVPALSYLLGRPVSPRIGFGALLAMIGVYVLEQATGTINFGDGLALLSALCYSVHVLRLEKIDQPSIPLVEAKTRFQTILALGLLAIHPGRTVEYLQQFPSDPTWEQFALIVGVLWLGICSTALATWLQVVGQRIVGGSRAAVFYASQPAWAVGLAYAAGLDTVQMNEIFGTVMIVIAGLLTGLE